MLSDARNLTRDEWYFRALLIALACYAVIGKGFAYVGVPPLFIGEVLLLVGLVLWAGSRFRGLNSSSPAQLLLIGFMLWGAARTVPGIARYGADAFRDAVVWGYGIFALLISWLLVARPQRLAELDRAYLRFAKMFLAISPFAFVIGMWFGGSFPTWPGSNVPIYGPYKTSDTMVHLTGVFAYLSVCLPVASALRPWMFIAMGCNLLANFNGRSGLVAFICGTIVSSTLRPLSRLALGTAAMAAAGLALLWVTGINIELPPSGRYLSFEQFAENITSITSDTQREELGGSRRWRLAWWDTIYKYTLHGEYFWYGKGFGINLANADGFQVSADESLRSPHNGHLTILARSGVPGLTLWAATQFAWALTLFDSFVRAARSGQRRWAGTFVFLMAYWAAFMANIAFDVYLEGPVGGIWFWSLFGIGLGAVRIYKTSPDVLRDEPPAEVVRKPKAAARRWRRPGRASLPAPVNVPARQPLRALPPG